MSFNFGTTTAGSTFGTATASKGFSFGSGSGDASKSIFGSKTENKPAFSFTSPTTAAGSAFSFGAKPATTAATSFLSPTTTASAFGGGAAFGGFSSPTLGQNQQNTGAVQQSSIFGTPSTQENKPFSFTSPQATTSAPAFGGGAFSFGAKTTAPSLFSSPSTTSSTGFGAASGFGAFGSPPNQTVATPIQQPTAQVAPNTQQITSAFGQTQGNQPAFGFPNTQAVTTSTPFGGGAFTFGAKTTAPSLFSSPQPTTSSTAFSAGSSFGAFASPPNQTVATSIQQPTAQVAPQNTQTGVGAQAAGGLFGATAQTSASSGFSSAFSFGAKPVATNTTTLSFGANAPTTTASALDFSTTTTASGAPPKATTASGFNFGATATTAGLGGTTGTGTSGTTTFGTSAPATTTAGISFGTTQNLSFGAKTTTAAFGTTTTAPGLSFGTTGTPTFGTTPATAAASFGTTATTGISSSFGTTKATTSAAVSQGTGAATSTSAGFTFGTTQTTAGTVPSFGTGVGTTSAGLSFATAATTSAGVKLGFSQPAATAASSTSATSGITTLGTTASTVVPQLTAVTTAAAAPPAQITSMSFAQLEEAINNWTLELEDQEKTFINQATQINAWDRLLIANGEKIVELNEVLQNVKSEQQAIENELEFVLGQQKELENILAPLEKQLAETAGDRVRDAEREQMYSLAENLDTQLRQMSEDLKEVIEYLNETNRSQDTNDPIVQIGRILNAHMSSMQWIDNSITQISAKVDQLKATHDTLRRDNRRSFQLTYS